MSYPGFKGHGLDIIAAFDVDKKKLGKRINGIEIQPIDDMAKEIKDKDISMGIIAVPAGAAQDVADKLIKSGVECILNFAPTSLNVPENVRVKDVDLSRELETLSYFLANKKAS